jgi:hypothetical protein
MPRFAGGLQADEGNVVVPRLNRLYAVLPALVALIVVQQWVGAMFDSGRLAGGFYDAFHGFWYALLTWLVLVVLQQRFAPFSIRLWLVAIWSGMLGFAVLNELAKALVEQQPGIRDVLLNMMGVTAVLGLWAAERGLFRLRAAAAMASILLVASTFPLWQATALQNYRDGLMPDLVRFDDPRVHRLMVSNSATALVEAPAEWPGQAQRPVLAVTFADTEFPGITFPEPVPDWHGYSRLVLELYQPQERQRPMYLRVLVRLRGAVESYWIDERYQLEQGAHRIELELDRYHDRSAARIAEVQLHTNEDYRDWRLLVGALRLE